MRVPLRMPQKKMLIKLEAYLTWLKNQAEFITNKDYKAQNRRIVRSKERVKLFIPLLFLSLFFGCASFHPRPISPSETASKFEMRTLQSKKLESFIEKNIHKKEIAWPPASWDFKMLSLAAAYYSPALDVMRAKWGVANAAIITAGGIPNPAIGLLGQHHSITPGGISPWE